MKDDDLAERIEADFETSGVDERRLEMLRFAAKLTREPGAMERGDIEQLKEAGLSDTDILHVVEVTAYYAYANRLADGLGVPLEDWIPDEGT